MKFKKEGEQKEEIVGLRLESFGDRINLIAKNDDVEAVIMTFSKGGFVRHQIPYELAELNGDEDGYIVEYTKARLRRELDYPSNLTN